jgi:uncharacterized damage-inducible protein DinB
MKEQLISLYEYGVWVNQRLLASAEAVTAEKFTQKVLPGYGSLQLALAHLLGAEVLWFARWQGQSPKTILSPQDLPSVAAVQTRLKDLSGERRTYLASLDEAALAKPLQWTNMRGQTYTLPLWQVMLHCANHSTHHRSEVSAILTGLGHPPDSTDLLEFYLGQAGQAWKPSS